MTEVKIDAIKRRMEWHDSLPENLRRMADVLPNGEFLFMAVEAGCTTPVDAERWFRELCEQQGVYGPHSGDGPGAGG